jgi:serine/threonine protein kinase
MDDLAVDIFARALKLQRAEREALLDQTSAGDPALGQRVRAMLAAYDAREEQTAEVLNREPRTIMNAMREQPGAMVGPYKILQEIGEGGFGFVYMAQQTAPIKRKVALKIVKPGMDTRQVIGRFEAERQALAMMDHPNIAKVLDAGATPTGRPYFVMELVRGVPITEYCDTNSLPMRERLDLFMHVCHAVLHAHQKGIIHRDIKPSNVMVTLHDGAPVPKVIDFGIAKATGQDLTDKTVFTEYRHFIGTPEYMSPEQAAMSGLDVDTRADIYSLGVLLYELLTGTTPLDRTKLRSAGLAEIQKIIAEQEPDKPSTRVGHTASGKPSTDGAGRTRTAAEVAKQRRTDPGALRKTLSGDLDWIVMKAIEKDRTRRYATAGALAEDIRRYLASEPIMARPPSTTYKIRKFARRNRAALATGGALISALVVTLAALAFGYARVSRERDFTAERETVTRAEMLMSTMNSVRLYTTNNVRKALNEAHGDTPKFTKESVPGYAALVVFENFRKDPQYRQFRYKEASLNPTNIANLADDFEATLLNKYRTGQISGTQQGVKEAGGDRQFYIARPMSIADSSCLECHTTPEAAPPEQVRLYGRDHGYGWKLGEVIAAQVVYVPVNEAFRADPRTTYWVIGGLAAAFILATVGLVVILGRA